MSPRNPFVRRAAFAVAVLLAVSSVFATAPALDPSNARGVFWKQQKVQAGSEENASLAPGTWGYNRNAIFTKLKSVGINVVVIDVDANVSTSAANAIGTFITDLYNWDTTMPIKVWLHQRRYFRGGTDLSKTPDQNDPEFQLAAQDIKAIFQAVGTSVSRLIDGIRWGENGDPNMATHLKRAILYARKINATSYEGATNWLTNHSYIINGFDMGCEFGGLLAAQDSVGFSAKILPQVGAFGFAYKHFCDRATGGISATFDAWRTSFNPDKLDTIDTWKQFYRAELGIDELQQWIRDRSSGKAKNYIYIGDSADALSTTPANSLEAMKEMSLEAHNDPVNPIAKMRPVFMLPVAALSEKTKQNTYYKDEKVLFWMSGSTSSPTFTQTPAAIYDKWSLGW